MSIELIKTPSKTIFVDVMPSYTVNGSADQTEYAVEDGSTRSDHKILKPLELEIEVAQTEQPIDDPTYVKQVLDVQPREVQTAVTSPFLLAGAALSDVASSIVGLIRKPEPKKHEVLAAGSDRDRGGELQDELLALLNSESELVTVTIKGRTYVNLSLINLAISGVAGETGLTRFACSFRAIKIETLETVALPNPASLAFVAPKNEGKNKKDDDNAEKKVGERPKSLLITGYELSQ